MSRFQEGDYVSTIDPESRVVFYGTIFDVYPIGDKADSHMGYGGDEILDEGCRLYGMILDDDTVSDVVTIGHADLSLVQAARTAMACFTITVPGRHVRDGTVQWYVDTHMNELSPAGPEPVELLEDDDEV